MQEWYVFENGATGNNVAGTSSAEIHAARKPRC